MRTNANHRQVSFSDDQGVRWSPPTIVLNETACEASTISLPEFPGGATLVMSSAFSASDRSNLTLHTSTDGIKWVAQRRVVSGEGVVGLIKKPQAHRSIPYAGSAAYSSLAALNRTAVGILVEIYNYSLINYAACDLVIES